MSAVMLGDVLGQLKGARKSGSGWIARCPAHDDRNPSLSITEGDTQPVLLKCQAGCTFEAIAAALGRQASDFCSTDRVDEPPKLTAMYAYHNEDGTVFARKQRFMDSRGGKTFRWSHPNPDRAGEWRHGTVGTIPLYRLPLLNAAGVDEVVVIVEGEKDADRLAALGYVATTTPNGASSKWREDDSKYFIARRVCVIADDDAAGKGKAQDTASALRGIAASVGVITMPNPNGIKGFDVSDFLDSGGNAEDLRKRIENFEAAELPPEVVPHDELTRRVLTLWETGVPRGEYPGWKSLAELVRPRIPGLMVVTGAPGAGKSTFVDDLMLRLGPGYGTDDVPGSRWRWIIFSAEQFPAERHAAMLVQKTINKPFSEGPTARLAQGEAAAALRVLGDYFTFLNPSFANCTLDRVLEVVREMNSRRKVHGLVIDPYNVISAMSRSQGDNEHEFINSMLTKLRAFAQSEQVFVVIVAHPTKLKRESESPDADYPVVRPWDISGSGTWYAHGDYMLSVWRSSRAERAESGEVEVHVQKIRFQPECGQLGMVRLYFDKLTGRFNETQRHTIRRVPDGQLAPWESR